MLAPAGGRQRGTPARSAAPLEQTKHSVVLLRRHAGEDPHAAAGPPAAASGSASSCDAHAGRRVRHALPQHPQRLSPTALQDGDLPQQLLPVHVAAWILDDLISKRGKARQGRGVGVGGAKERAQVQPFMLLRAASGWHTCTLHRRSPAARCSTHALPPCLPSFLPLAFPLLSRLLAPCRTRHGTPK